MSLMAYCELRLKSNEMSLISPELKLVNMTASTRLCSSSSLLCTYRLNLLTIEGRSSGRTSFRVRT